MTKETVAIGNTGSQMVDKLDNNFTELYSVQKANDFIYWKPEGQAAFFYCTGQSLTEPAYPLHPDAPPLEYCEGVQIWRSNGYGTGWDFYPFDPDQPLSPDFEPYDATTNPNGRPSTVVDGKLRWDVPYTGYGGGGFYSWFIGLALQYHQATGRTVYIGNTAWGGRSSFQWRTDAPPMASYGKCFQQIADHMPNMQARLYELEPDLGATPLWDAFAFNQSSTDAGIESYGYPPEVYVANWSDFLEYAGATEIDGYGQAIPTRWFDPSKCSIALLERTKRDENFPQWNGQELLLEAYAGRMQMITSAKRLIWDTEGVDGETGALPGSPPYNLHFWGDVCIDFGRDVAKHMISTGCGKARTDIRFHKHNTSTKLLAGVYTFAGSAYGGIVDPGTGVLGTQGTTSLSISKTDLYGNLLQLEEVLPGDTIYIYSRTDKTAFYTAVVDTVTLDTDYIGFTIASYTNVWEPLTDYTVEVVFDRTVYLTETVDDVTTYYSDALYREPYRRRGINFAENSIPNATENIKAHDDEGRVLHLESFSPDATKVSMDVVLSDAEQAVIASFSHQLLVALKGTVNTIATVDATTGATKAAMRFVDGYPLPVNSIYGSIRAVNNSTAVTISASPTITAANALWNVDGTSNGIVPDQAAGTLTVPVSGAYTVGLTVQSGTMTASTRTIMYISIEGSQSTYFGVMESNGAGELSTFTIEGTFLLAAGNVIDSDFLQIAATPATTTTVKYAELRARLIEAT